MPPLHLAAVNGHDSTVKIFEAVSAIPLSFDELDPEQLEKLQQSIPSSHTFNNEILGIRFRTYFRRSLLLRLL